MEILTQFFINGLLPTKECMKSSQHVNYDPYERGILIITSCIGIKTKKKYFSDRDKKC